MWSCGTSISKSVAMLLVCSRLRMQILRGLYLRTARKSHLTVPFASECACLLCRLFNELIENIYQWDSEQDVEDLVTLLASYSQERFLVCFSTRVVVRQAHETSQAAMHTQGLLCQYAMSQLG